MVLLSEPEAPAAVDEDPDPVFNGPVLVEKVNPPLPPLGAT